MSAPRNGEWFVVVLIWLAVFFAVQMLLAIAHADGSKPAVAPPTCPAGYYRIGVTPQGEAVCAPKIRRDPPPQPSR